MTTRLKGFVITLEKDLREDDAEGLKKALGMVRGVRSVDPIPANVNDHIAEVRVRHELGSKLMDVLFKKEEP